MTEAAANSLFVVCFPSFLFRDDGLNNSQAHIALNDHTSLFQENKEHLHGIFHLLCLRFSLTPVIIVMTSASSLRLCLDCDSDSDSDLSLEDDQSGSYASTHSSDSEDEEGPLPHEECWESLAANVGKRPPPSQGTEPQLIQTLVLSLHLTYLTSNAFLLKSSSGTQTLNGLVIVGHGLNRVVTLGLWG